VSKLNVAAPQSVGRIFHILDFLSVQPEGESLASIARVTGAPKNSIIGLLAGMVENGYLTRDERAIYRIGPTMFSLAMRIAGGMRLPGLVRPALERLMAETGETALAGTLVSGADVITYFEKVESVSPVRYTVSLGERRELYPTAMGKLVLAFMEPGERDAYLRSHPLHQFTGSTITSVRVLRAELKTIRRTGVSHTSNERVIGASAIAAAVLGAHKQFITGIGIAGPSERIELHREAHTRLLMREANVLSGLLAQANVAHLTVT
jgi:DNA-binding IclR family transcriptional regulator